MCRFPASFIFSDKICFRIGRHLFLFVLMIFLFTWIVLLRERRISAPWDTLWNVFVNSVFFFGYAYFTAYVLVPNLLVKRRYVLFGLVFLFAGIMISCLKFIFSDYVFYTAIGGDLNTRLKAVDLSHILVNTKDMTFIVALFLIAKYARDNQRVRSRLSRLENDQIRSEIRLLRKQLDPHVVFNNLNNLYCLSLNGHPEVYTNLGRLSSLLSYYFMDGKNREVKISRELQAIADYLELEKLRYGDRINVSYSVKGDPGNRKIAPLVLFPFVEYCIQHGCSLHYGVSWIKIQVGIRPQQLHLQVFNSKPGKENAWQPGNSGMVLNDPAKRLELLYEGRYSLNLGMKEDHSAVDLKIEI